MSGTVVVVTNIPRPYRSALFAVLEERLAAQDLGLRVLYTSDPTKHVRRGLAPKNPASTQTESFVPSVSFRFGYERVVNLPVGLGRALRDCRPSCVLSGGFGAAALLGNLWCRRRGVPYVLWSGAWPGGEPNVGRIESASRARLIRHSDSYVSYGTAAADYLMSLDAPPDRVCCGWNTVDLEGIAKTAALASAQRQVLCLDYGLATHNLLFVGSLVERKGLRELVAAALQMNAPGVDWALHLVGDGPLREELESTVREAGKESRFRFHGLRPENDVAELLGTASGFILPTKREAWGLVVNEAMACGVPVVASPWAGATRDLIVDGVTGFIVEPTDVHVLATAMARLISGDPGCKEIGRAGALAVREKASLSRSADGFVNAVCMAIEGHRDGAH